VDFEEDGAITQFLSAEQIIRKMGFSIGRLVPGAKPESLTVIEIGRNSSTLLLRLTSGAANSI